MQYQQRNNDNNNNNNNRNIIDRPSYQTRVMMKLLENGWMCDHDDFQTIQLHNRKDDDPHLYLDLCFPENYIGRNDDGQTFTFHLSDHKYFEAFQRHIYDIAPTFAAIRPNISFQNNDSVMDSFYWRFRTRPPASADYDAPYIRNFRELHSQIVKFIGEFEQNYANSPLHAIFGDTLSPNLRRRKEFPVEIFIKGLYCSTKFKGGYIEHDREVLKVHQVLTQHYNLTAKQVKIWRCWNYPTNDTKKKSNRGILKVDVQMSPQAFISDFYSNGFHLVHSGLAPMTIEPLTSSPASAFKKRFKLVAKQCMQRGLIRRWEDEDDDGGSGRNGRNFLMQPPAARSVPNSANDKESKDDDDKGQGNNSDDAHSASNSQQMRKSVLYKPFESFVELPLSQDSRHLAVSQDGRNGDFAERDVNKIAALFAIYETDEDTDGDDMIGTLGCIAKNSDDDFVDDEKKSDDDASDYEMQRIVDVCNDDVAVMEQNICSKLSKIVSPPPLKIPSARKLEFGFMGTPYSTSESDIEESEEKIIVDGPTVDSDVFDENLRRFDASVKSDFKDWAMIPLKNRPFDFDIDPIRRNYRRDLVAAHSERRGRSLSPIKDEVNEEQAVSVWGTKIISKLNELRADKKCTAPSYAWKCVANLPVTPESDDSEGASCEPADIEIDESSFDSAILPKLSQNDKIKFGTAPPLRMHNYGEQVYVFDPTKRNPKKRKLRKLNWADANISSDDLILRVEDLDNKNDEIEANANLTPASISTAGYSSNDASNDASDCTQEQKADFQPKVKKRKLLKMTSKIKSAKSKSKHKVSSLFGSDIECSETPYTPSSHSSDYHSQHTPSVHSSNHQSPTSHRSSIILKVST